MILLIILEHLNVIVVLTVHVNRICMPNRFVSFVSKKKTLSFSVNVIFCMIHQYLFITETRQSWWEEWCY